MRLLIVGDSAIGKSCFVNWLQHLETPHLKPDSYASRPTIGCSLEVLPYPNTPPEFIELVEVGGRSKHPKTKSVFLKQNLTGIVLCYDLSNIKSLKGLWDWIQSIEAVYDIQSLDLQTLTSQHDRTLLSRKKSQDLIGGNDFDFTKGKRRNSAERHPELINRRPQEISLRIQHANKHAIPLLLVGLKWDTIGFQQRTEIPEMAQLLKCSWLDVCTRESIQLGSIGGNEQGINMPGLEVLKSYLSSLLDK